MIKTILPIAVLTILSAYNIFTYPRASVLVLLPILVFILLHYFILQKLFNHRFPFQYFVTKMLPRRNLPKDERHLDGMTLFYGITLTIAAIAYLLIVGIANYFHLNFKEALEPIGPGAFLLLFAAVTTVVLFLYSSSIFAKPIERTWQTILFAGIIATGVAYAASFGLWKVVGPYLPVDSCILK